MGMNAKPVLTESFVSEHDLRLCQYYGVKLNADRQIHLSENDADICIGILQNKPNAGEVAEVMIIGRTPVVAGATLAYGNQLRVLNGGKVGVMTPVSANYNIGRCVEGSGTWAVAEMAVAEVNFANSNRGR